jgi:hypothetical protein
MTTCEERNCEQDAVEYVEVNSLLTSAQTDYGFCDKHWPETDDGIRELMDEIRDGQYDYEERLQMFRYSVERRPAMYLREPDKFPDFLRDEDVDELKELAEELIGDSDE